MLSTRDRAGVTDKTKIFVGFKRLSKRERERESGKASWSVLQHAALTSASCAL